MILRLHNPVNRAHLEDLKDRLSAHLAFVPADPYHGTWTHAVIGTLVDVVRTLDQGSISAEDAQRAFAAFRIPGFRFEWWLAEMVDEGVYVEAGLAEAA